MTERQVLVHVLLLAASDASYTRYNCTIPLLNLYATPSVVPGIMAYPFPATSHLDYPASSPSDSQT
jgi:hypothetical protein